MKDGDSTAVAALILRITLAAGLLSAVADRFGLWGAAGTGSVAWGNFASFLVYTAKLNPWCPASLIPVVGWSATAAEAVLGVSLLFGYRLRGTAAAAALLTTIFGAAMALHAGWEAPLNYSVFGFAAGAYLLACVSSPMRHEASRRN